MFIDFDMGYHQFVKFLKECHTKLFNGEELNEQDVQQMMVMTNCEAFLDDDQVLGAYIDGLIKADQMFSVKANMLCVNKGCEACYTDSNIKFQTKFNYCPYCAEQLQEEF